MELQFVVVSIERNAKNAYEYLGQEAIESKRIFENAKKYPDYVNKLASMEEVDNKLITIDSEIEANKIKKRSIKYFAEEANLIEDYETYYGFLCNTSHGNISDVRKHFVFDNNGIIKSFNWGPEEKEIRKLMLATIDIMLNIIKSICKSFSLDVKDEISQLDSKFKNLHIKIEL